MRYRKTTVEEGAHVMVEVFDDRVEIYNPGGLPKGLSEKDFGCRSVCRNPNIAGLLLRCDYIEKMGSGIERIHAALAKENCPRVNIRYDVMFTLQFPRPTHSETDAASEQTLGRVREKTMAETMVKTRVETREKTRVKILKLIADNQYITTAQLADAIGITPKGVEWQIIRLKEEGLLKRIGPAKGGHWEVNQ